MKKDSTPLFQISRNFVEFGPFTTAEIAGFRQRGVLSDHDYVRSTESPEWLSLGLWLTQVSPEVVESKTPAKAAPRKRSAPAAKASKKAA